MSQPTTDGPDDVGSTRTPTDSETQAALDRLHERARAGEDLSDLIHEILLPTTSCTCGAVIEWVADEHPYWRHVTPPQRPHGAAPVDPDTALERVVHHLVHRHALRHITAAELAALLTASYKSLRRYANRRPCWALEPGGGAW